MSEEIKKIDPAFGNASLLFARLVVAAIFLFAAWAKYAYLQQPLQETGALMLSLTWIAMIAEPLGAIALIIGFLTRWAAAGLGIIMIVAIFLAKFIFSYGFFTTPQGPGFDYNVLILALCALIVSFGAGKWSIDSKKSRA